MYAVLHWPLLIHSNSIQSFRSDSCLSQVQIVLMIFSTKDKGSYVASVKHIQRPLSKSNLE